ncbi:MAG: hemolysin family protein [Proteobacteria bacterium]|jgi:putative hemolysin|nr:hemolysin family protein [Pseudomonadota bacterium]
MLSELGLVLLLALANGFFALSEMAIVTARRSRLKQMARDSKRAALALRLAEAPERFLSTVQVGITLIAILTGVVTGASIGDHIALWLQGLGWIVLLPYARPLGYALGIALITYLNIVIGELVPKRLALVAPEKLAMIVGAPMLALARLAAPFVLVLNASSNGLLRLLRMGRDNARERISEEEIRLLVAESAEQGVLDEDERAMVSRVLRLGDRTVGSVMTPRPRIAWLDAAATLDENLGVLRETPYSRYPVYRGSESDILGVLEVKRLLEPLTRGDMRLDLFRTLAKPLYVPGSARALDLLEEFRDAETQLALVVDEYGDIEGLVTFHNLLEAVVGRPAPVVDAGAADAPIVRRADGSYLVDGALSIEDLRELLGNVQLPEEPDLDYHTVAGLLMARAGRIPSVGEIIEWQGVRFEILDLDGTRIDRVLLSLGTPGQPA